MAFPNLSAKAIETQEMKLTCNTYLGISNANALEMLKNSTKAKVSGIINGYVVLPGSFSRSIPDVPAKPVLISFKGEYKPINIPQTGDTFNIVLYVALAAVAGIVIGTIMRINKKNGEK